MSTPGSASFTQASNALAKRIEALARSRSGPFADSAKSIPVCCKHVVPEDGDTLPGWASLTLRRSDILQTPTGKLVEVNVGESSSLDYPGAIYTSHRATVKDKHLILDSEKYRDQARDAESAAVQVFVDIFEIISDVHRVAGTQFSPNMAKPSPTNIGTMTFGDQLLFLLAIETREFQHRLRAYSTSMLQSACPLLAALCAEKHEEAHKTLMRYFYIAFHAYKCLYRAPDHTYLSFASKLGGTATGMSDAQLSKQLGAMLQECLITGDGVHITLDESDRDSYSGHNRAGKRPFLGLAYLVCGLAGRHAPAVLLSKMAKQAHGRLVGGLVVCVCGTTGEAEGDCIIGMEGSSLCTVNGVRRHMMCCHPGDVGIETICSSELCASDDAVGMHTTRAVDPFTPASAPRTLVEDSLEVGSRSGTQFTHRGKTFYDGEGWNFGANYGRLDSPYRVCREITSLLTTLTSPEPLPALIANVNSMAITLSRWSGPLRSVRRMHLRGFAFIVQYRMPNAHWLAMLTSMYIPRSHGGLEMFSEEMVYGAWSHARSKGVMEARLQHILSRGEPLSGIIADMTAFAYAIGPLLPPPMQNLSIKIALSSLATERRQNAVSDEIWAVASDCSFRNLAQEERLFLDTLLEASVPTEIVDVIASGLLGQHLMTKRKEALSSRFLRRNRAPYRVERDPASVMLLALSYYAERNLNEERVVDTSRDSIRGYRQRKKASVQA